MLDGDQIRINGSRQGNGRVRRRLSRGTHGPFFALICGDVIELL